ncbi:MAG TPA: hypothetical protein VFV50_03135 [Bdellovibrionales bacterium]|nr:hypothetical protein [Bdellovibrionales bacterium]
MRHHRLILLSVFFASSAFAAETAKVLPKNIFRARVVGIQTEAVSDRYNDQGLLEGFTTGLNRTVTVADLVAKSPDLGRLVNTLNSLQPGLGSQLLNANIYNSFEQTQRQWIPALEYGITDRSTIGIRVPIVRRTVRTRFWVDSNNQAYQTALAIGAINPDVQTGLKTFQDTGFGTQFFAASLFTDKGYQVPEDFDVTEMGDVEIGYKFNFYKNNHWLLSTGIGARAPTGSTAALDNIFDKGSGTGAWGVGSAWYEAYQPASWFVATAMQKFTYSFPDRRDRAVPRDENDSLPSVRPQDGQVQSVLREQTAMLEMEISGTFYMFETALSTWGAYQYANKGKDRYTGAGNLYYAGLAKGTDYEKHNGEIGIGYSTIPAFRRGQFKVPAEFNLLYNTTIDGKNTPLTSYVRMDMMMYF